MKQLDKMLPWLILLGGAVVFSWTCTKEHLPSPGEVCFEAEVFPLIQSNCTQSGCHNASDQAGEVVLNSYERIRALTSPGNYRQSELYRILVQPAGRMPQAPYDPLPDEQIAVIARWIEQGALETVNCAGSCDTSNVTYSLVVRPILDTYCNGCHGGASPQGDLRLTGYNDVKPTVTNGSLLGSIRHGGSFSPMPKDADKLPACKIAQIEKWVAAGAPNN